LEDIVRKILVFRKALVFLILSVFSPVLLFSARGVHLSDPYLEQILERAPEYSHKARGVREFDNVPTIIPYNVMADTLRRFCFQQEILLGAVRGAHIRKVELKPDDILLMTGDLHGTVHHLIRNLIRWKLMGYIDHNLKLSKGVYLIFTGDLGDRGHYGSEAWYVVMQLILNNPYSADGFNSQVILTRGNHEDEFLANYYGLGLEVSLVKYDEILFSLFVKTFEFVPYAVFLSIFDSFIQVNHGGMPVDKSGNSLISGLGTFLKNKKKKIKEIDANDGHGYLWNDYRPGKKIVRSRRGKNCYKVGVDLVRKKHNIKNNLRGHEHNPFTVSYMGKDGRWEGLPSKTPIKLSSYPVYTFSSLPRSMGGPKIVDGFGMISIGETYDKSTITVFKPTGPVDPKQWMITQP